MPSLAKAGRTRQLLLTVPLVALGLTLAACGSDGDDQAPEQTTTAAAASGASTAPDTTEQKPEQPAAAATGTKITTGDSQFGEILFDGDDRAIYYFDKEQNGRSECYGACAVAWPPVLTDGRPFSAGGAQSNLVGSVKRDDGTTQVTYDGRPLYYYVDDPPGVILCHNVEEFGGLWLAVEPDGAPVP
jgi:predicted lipoprotein with Yx(FWY)xxD motif